jgi:hypothetical protein
MSIGTKLVASVAEVLAPLDPDALGPAAAREEMAHLVRAERMIAARRVELARRVEETNAWVGTGARSAAEYVSNQTGQSMGRAGDELATSRRLQRCPRTAQALRDGELSTSQASLIADAATADPGAEAGLLDHAARSGSFKTLRERAHQARAAATDHEAREKRIHAERSLRYGTDRDGAFTLYLRGPAADGARIVAALRPFEERIFRQARHDAKATGDRPTYENRAYDAFLERFFAGGAADADVVREEADEPDPPTKADQAAGTDDVGPHPEGGARSDTPTEAGSSAGTNPPHPPPNGRDGPKASNRRGGKEPKLPGGDNVKVIVRIDHAALLRGCTVAGETCEIAGVGPVSAAAVRDLLDSGDPFVAAVILDGHDVHTVAHLGRQPTAYQRTAIEATSIRCTNISCNGTVGIEIDHRIDWHETHHTKLDELDPLCRACHTLKTHRDWQLEPGQGRRRFRPPPGRVLDITPPPEMRTYPTLQRRDGKVHAG